MIMKRSPLGNGQVTVLQVIRNSYCLAHYFVTIFEWFLLQSDLLKQVRTMEKASCDLVKGDRDRLIEVKIKWFVLVCDLMILFLVLGQCVREDIYSVLCARQVSDIVMLTASWK